MAKENQEIELETVTKAEASVDVEVEQNEKNTVSETTQTLSASNLIKEFENEQLKKVFIFVSSQMLLIDLRWPRS